MWCRCMVISVLLWGCGGTSPSPLPEPLPAPVAAGEVVILRWGVYDSGDGLLDSTTVIDAFRWLGNAVDDPSTYPYE